MICVRACVRACSLTLLLHSIKILHITSKYWSAHANKQTHILIRTRYHKQNSNNIQGVQGAFFYRRRLKEKEENSSSELNIDHNYLNTSIDSDRWTNTKKLFHHKIWNETNVCIFWKFLHHSGNFTLEHLNYLFFLKIWALVFLAEMNLLDCLFKINS